MNTDYRYLLETPKLTGHRQQKTMCPQCGRKSLVRYVDTYNGYGYLADEVGKCDHQNSCQYHYRPKDYFQDNAWLRDNPTIRLVQKPPMQKPTPPMQPLPIELVAQYHSPNSVFWDWFKGTCAKKLNIAEDAIERVYEDYCIGADERCNVIFNQIDEQGRFRSGHIMQYYSDGHHHNGYQNWVHDKLKKEGQLPSDWVLYQCLFGEHLLQQRPNTHVCLVESEKTTIVMAVYQPEYLWLATSGCGGLSQEKLACLRGRRVTIFPDSGCYEKWSKQMQFTQDIDYTVTDALETYPPNTDLCDVLLDEV